MMCRTFQDITDIGTPVVLRPNLRAARGRKSHGYSNETRRGNAARNFKENTKYLPPRKLDASAVDCTLQDGFNEELEQHPRCARVRLGDVLQAAAVDDGDEGPGQFLR